MSGSARQLVALQQLRCIAAPHAMKPLCRRLALDWARLMRLMVVNDAGQLGCRHGLPAPEHLIVARAPQRTAPHDGMTTTGPLAASTANCALCLHQVLGICVHRIIPRTCRCSIALDTSAPMLLAVVPVCRAAATTTEWTISHVWQGGLDAPYS